MAVGGAIALLMYGWFLAADSAGVTGDAVVGQAMEVLLALLLLWLVLLALVAIDRVLGGPSWARRAGYLVIPVAGIATFFATDYPGDRLSRQSLVAVPLLIGAYLLAGRLKAPLAGRAQAAILLPVALLAWYSIALFAA